MYFYELYEIKIFCVLQASDNCFSTLPDNKTAIFQPNCHHDKMRNTGPD